MNTSEYRLLPGTVNVYLDNSPVSKVFIPVCSLTFPSNPVYINIFSFAMNRTSTPMNLSNARLGPIPPYESSTHVYRAR